MSDPIVATPRTLVCADGTQLAAQVFEPIGSVRAVIVIAPAMAVPQGFYANFARHLAENGFRVWTFDYRGIGNSLQGSMRGVQTSLTTWIEQDYDCAIRSASDEAGNLPLFVIGHSFGGQTAPLLPSRERISGLITVAAGSGSMAHNTPSTRRAAPLLWYVLIPLLCPLFGYFPGARLGVIGDVPSGSMREWRRWCLTPEYLLSGEPRARAAYASARYPVLALAFSDDELLLETGVRLLHNAYQATTPDYRYLNPQQQGWPRIGHFGFFKSSSGATVWPQVLDWLTQRLAAR